MKPKIIEVGNIANTGKWNSPQYGRIYSTDGIGPTLNAHSGGNLEVKIIEIVRYEEASLRSKPVKRPQR